MIYRQEDEEIERTHKTDFIERTLLEIKFMCREINFKIMLKR